MTGMYASTAILAALRHRDATGEGQHIDLSLVDTQLSWMVNEGVNYLLSGKEPKRRGNQHRPRHTAIERRRHNPLQPSGLLRFMQQI